MGQERWRVLLFGRLRDLYGVPEIVLQAKAATAADLRAALAATHPDLAATILAPSIRMAVNQRLIADEVATPVKIGDEVAFLPPLSGG